jgi:tripartite-type tricarboxylate transporter receptor subunit TctC
MEARRSAVMRHARLIGALRPLVLLVAVSLVVAACSGGSDGEGSGGGGAEGYPDRNITVVVPFSAGGPTDTVTRLIADPMSKKLGAQIVV